MPPPIIIPLKMFDPALTIDNQSPIGDNSFGYIVADSGYLQTKKPIKDFDTAGALANGGRVVISEVRTHAFGFAQDDVLVSQMFANDLAGDGEYTLPIVNANIASNSDGDRAAGQELALRVGDSTLPLSMRVKGGISFDTFSREAEIGVLAPYRDDIDDVNDKFPIQEINFAIIGDKLERQCKCAKTVQRDLMQLSIDAFRFSTSPPPRRNVDNGS